MKRKFSLVIALLLLALTSVTVWAQSNGDYDLTWFSIDGGGGEASGGTYIIYSTIGQFDAGVRQGGSYTLSGGFLAGIDSALTLSYDVYLPLILR